MHNGAINGNEKAAIIKELLCIDPNDVLMKVLGERRKVALIREAQAEWEFVIPHSLLEQLDHSERVVARFQRHATMLITHRWKQESSDEWALWREEENAVSDCIPDLNMSWLDE